MVATGGGGGATPEVNIAVKHKGGSRDDAAQIKPRLPHQCHDEQLGCFFQLPTHFTQHSSLGCFKIPNDLCAESNVWKELGEQRSSSLTKWPLLECGGLELRLPWRWSRMGRLWEAFGINLFLFLSSITKVTPLEALQSTDSHSAVFFFSFFGQRL